MVWEQGIQIQVPNTRSKLWVVAKVIDRKCCENKTSFRIEKEDDEDEAFQETAEDDKSSLREILFIAYES